jgi:hypothetical protein
VDTTRMSVAEVVETMVKLVEDRGKKTRKE